MDEFDIDDFDAMDSVEASIFEESSFDSIESGSIEDYSFDDMEGLNNEVDDIMSMLRWKN